MDVHRKFTFENPEDSYWNESGPNPFDLTNFDNKPLPRYSAESIFRPSQASFFDEDNDRDGIESITGRSQLELDFDSKIGLGPPEDEAPGSSSNCSTGGLIRQKASSCSINTNGSQVPEEKIPMEKVANGIRPSANKISRCGGSNVSMLSDSSQSQGSFSYNSEMTVHLDYARLKSEHRKLQRHFESAIDSRYKAPSVAEAIKRLVQCQPISLEFYRSKQEKLDLLEAALARADWDVIITVVLFTKRTLTNNLFRQILIDKPIAAEYYLSYLKETNDFAELSDTLFGLGRSDEAAMVEFNLAFKKQLPKQKLDALKNCLIGGFSTHPSLTNEAKHLQEYISLLEKHIT